MLHSHEYDVPVPVHTILVRTNSVIKSAERPVRKCPPLRVEVHPRVLFVDKVGERAEGVAAEERVGDRVARLVLAR